MKTVDALNKEIVEDRTYGYSQNKNGITRIILGKAKKVNEGKVSLEILERKEGVYNHPPEPVKRISSISQAKIVSVKANMLFPVKLKETKNE